ncbi:ROK family transcriptional regulator [Nocardioides panacisoli]|uniref:ROK family transcriptional regulator n=1 Tax=Nocardioides panacisoli TaxID=627624 RepID=A0ABP7IFS3_9ACTN
MAENAGAELLRRRNAAAVLRSLRHDGPASRAELSGRTGLAKATVGSIVAGLEDAGAVREHEQVRSGDRGRPGVRLTLAGGRPVGVGLEANVEYVAAVVVDLSGTVRAQLTRPVASVGAVAEALAALADEVAVLVRDAGQRAIGGTVAVPGLIAEDDRTIAWTPNLGITGTGVAERVDRAFGWTGRVRVNNDADCAALAELHHGAGRGNHHLLYLTGTVGIGAGLVESGRLVRGARGFAGEVGHLPIGEPEARCGCGRTGCWEASVGLHALLARCGAAELATPEETAASLAERAATDPAVRAAIEETGRLLGRGLVIVSGMLDPAVVVLGGYFEPLGELVLAPARAVLAGALAAPVQQPPELRVGELGTEAAALGAAERAVTAVFDGLVDLV